MKPVDIKILERNDNPGVELYLLGKENDLPREILSWTKNVRDYLQELRDRDIPRVQLQDKGKTIFVQFVPVNEQESYRLMEEFRKAGADAFKSLSDFKVETVAIYSFVEEKFTACWLEGLLLRHYKFDKYITDTSEKKTGLRLLFGGFDKLPVQFAEMVALVECVNQARDWVNEPGSEMTATQLAESFTDQGKSIGFNVEVLDKKKISSLKMGGLLAVNSGSEEPPTFSILTYNPPNATNKKPIILVGKGVVFDTGGLSLKPTTNSMDLMKSDMSGAAAVGGVISALAKNKVPNYVIGIVPATDNRPGKSAYFPGDVVTMFDGSTVEVLNTDAEGRMILADALAYAKKYQPGLVIDIATLTGAAAVAIGEFASVGFFKSSDSVKDKMLRSAGSTYERLVEFPLWDEYNELLKSKIADVKNIGGRYGGAITAAKFLERFTDYPWIHLDIAGTAFNLKNKSYLPSGSSGVGVRLLYDFIKNYCHDSKKIKT